jgi:hypothetical protein
MENIDSILSLPKCSEDNVGRHRRINDPKAKVFTPLPEHKLQIDRERLMQTTI